MDKQSKFPERRAVSSPDNCPRSRMQFFSVPRVVERSASFFDDKRPEQSVLLVDICEQMVMEKYRPKLFICEKPLHQRLVSSRPGNVIPAVSRPV